MSFTLEDIARWRPSGDGATLVPNAMFDALLDLAEAELNRREKKRQFLLEDAKARQRGENFDGSPRREGEPDAP